MPRSSRHKSSKRSSRDVRDYSDSEDYSSSRDRKSKDESNGKVSKESASREKRKLEGKDINADCKEEYSTSKRRRDRVDDGDDRWNGGDDDRREGTKKMKDKFSESKSKRRDENAGVYGESDEMVKKSSRTTEGKHRDSSSKKEGKEGGCEKDKEREREKEKERDRKGKGGKTEKLIDADDLSTMKQASEKTELSDHMDSLPDRRIRKKRDDFSDGDLNHDDLEDINDRRLSSRGDVNKDGRVKEEKRKDERYKDKYRESLNTDHRNRDNKQTEECAGKDRINDKSDYKNSRDDKDNVDRRPKKHKHLAGDCDRERDHDHEHYHDFDASGDNDRETHRREREQDRDRGRERDRKLDREWDRDRDRDQDRERERNRDRSINYDVLPIDDRNGRYKDSNGRKRSLDDYDDDADTKSREFKTDFLETEKRSLNSRIESDVDRGKSQPHQEHAGNNAGSDKRTSPNTTSLEAADGCRQPKEEDMKYKDNIIEHRSSKSVSSRDVTGTAGSSERNSKYRSSEKHNKMDEGNAGELSIERSSTSKASPMGVMDRSPSSTSLDRRYTNRPGARRNLDIEESGRRSNASMGSRDDDRPNPEKSLMDDSTSVDSPFSNRTSQSNVPPSFRGGIGRGQGNAWRGGPNWTPPLPNGYIPFQHGPHHGAFPAMLPQFPSPLFGVRPSMEMNHSGIPYHISDADRFASHIGPLGWQTMHRWDGNNGVFRDEQNLYGGPDWDQSRHSLNSGGWDGNSDIWKGQNRDVNLDISKEDVPSQACVEDVPVGQGGQKSQKEGNGAKAADTKTNSPETTIENIAATPKSLEKENEPPYDAYLSQLDISAELADPELYDQSACFLNVKSKTAMEESTMLVNLKNGGRTVPKSSSVLLSSLMFSATSDSVFQRAMAIYKRQRACLGGLPIANALIIDAILGSKMEEEVPPNNNKTTTEEIVLNHNDQVSDMNSVDTKAESFSRIKEPEDKPVMDSSIRETEVTPSNVEVEMSKTETKGSSTLNSEEEMQGKCGPLGSPKTESESVILSRIHHSPESTH